MTAVAPLESPLHQEQQQQPTLAESRRASVAASAAVLRSLAQSRASLRRRQSQASASGSRPQSANRILLQARRDEERDFRCQFYTAVGLAVFGAALCIAGIGLAAYGLPTPDRLKREYPGLSAGELVQVEVRLMLYGRLGGLLLGTGVFFVVVLLVIGLDYKVYLDRQKPVENVVAEMNRRLYANIMQNLRKVASDDDTASLSTSHRSSDRRSSMAVALVGKNGSIGGGDSSVALRMSRPSTASGHRRNSLANLTQNGGRRNSLPVKEQQQRMQLSPSWKLNKGFDFSEESIEQLKEKEDSGVGNKGISSLDDLFNRSASPKSPFPPMEGIAEEGSSIPTAAPTATVINVASTTADSTDEAQAKPDANASKIEPVAPVAASPNRPFTPMIDGAPESGQVEEAPATATVSEPIKSTVMQSQKNQSEEQKPEQQQQQQKQLQQQRKDSNGPAAANRPPTAAARKQSTTAVSRSTSATSTRSTPTMSTATSGKSTSRTVTTNSRPTTAAASRPTTAASSKPTAAVAAASKTKNSTTAASSKPTIAAENEQTSQSALPPKLAGEPGSSRRPQTVASRRTSVASVSARQKTAAGASRQQQQSQSQPPQQAESSKSGQSRPPTASVQETPSSTRPETGFCRDYTMVFESDRDSNSDSSAASDEEVLYEQDARAGGGSGSQNNLNRPETQKPIKEKLLREDTTDENASQDQSIIEEMTREICRNLELDDFSPSAANTSSHQTQATASGGDSGFSVQVHVHVHVSKNSSPNRQEQSQQNLTKPLQNERDKQQEQQKVEKREQKQGRPQQEQEQEQKQEQKQQPRSKPNMLEFEHDGAI